MNERDSPATKPEFAALIGIDWADQKHDVCLRDADSGKIEQYVLHHTPEEIDQWANGLRERFDGQPVAVCLEQSKGALIFSLLKYDFIVIFPLNPGRLKSFRNAFANSGAKDDPTDARLLLDYLAAHREHLTAWKPDEPHTRQLALLVAERRKAVDLRTQLNNTLKTCLKNYFPQAIEWAGESLGTRIACDFLLKWTTLAALQKASDHTIRKFYYGHGCRHEKLVKKRLEAIRAAKPLTTDSAVIEGFSLTVEMLARQIRTLLSAIASFDKRIAKLMSTHADAAIFNSFPGAGSVMAPRLLAAFGSDRSKMDSAQDMQNFSGIAPVTRRSGKKHAIRRRRACPQFVHQSFHEYAGCSVRYSKWANAYYRLRRSQGLRHRTALRALAFIWIRIMHRCWKDGTPYDEARYLEVLRRRGSPLIEYLEKPPLMGD